MWPQVMEHCRARACWDTVMSNSEYDRRREAVEAFNMDNRCGIGGDARVAWCR